ncbi:MAG: glycosyltransferase [Ktedonobacteraceae bacterium]|nr:glycosyltransferase [Ktedonobacteraceae bacterium]
MQFDPLVVSLEIIVGILCVLFLMLLVNLCTFYRLHNSLTPLAYGRTQGNAPTQPAMPLLSILVPARNEEQCIEECIRSLIAQDYENLEVLVLDDQSTDATRTIIKSIIASLPEGQQARLQLLKGKDLPQGWVGKNFACHQLAQDARGSYLLFTDADTVHKPGMARAVIDCMHNLNVQLLTAQPEHLMESFGERMIVPLLNFTILTLLPVALISRRPEPSLATGNGQLLCFERLAYEKIGGHARVKGRILEDVLLARAIKSAGLRMTFVDAQEVIRCRMYRSFAEVWAGFSKNLFALYNYSLPFALCALVLNLALFVLPLTLLVVALFITLPAQTLILTLTAYLLPVLMRTLLTWRFIHTQKGLMVVLCVLHPCSILLECLILLNAIRWHYRKMGTRWKGRYYP